MQIELHGGGKGLAYVGWVVLKDTAGVKLVSGIDII